MGLRTRVRRLLRRLTGRENGPVVLMYHRVATLSSDPWGLAVSPENFAAQMEQISRQRIVLDMSDFVARFQARTLPRKAVAVTFDDGYVDNLWHAAPVLAAKAIPATLFLATGPSLKTQLYWFDVLESAILDARDPARTELVIGATRFPIEFDEREPADDARFGWRAWTPARTKRERVFYRIWEHLRGSPPDIVGRAMADVRRLLPSADARASEVRPMTVEELAQLLGAGNFRLGGHTVDHPSLVDLSDGEALDQLVRGKADVERLSGREAVGLAYPYGRNDRRIQRLAAEAGFRWACTTEERAVVPGDNLFTLPRMAATDSPRLNLG